MSTSRRSDATAEEPRRFEETERFTMAIDLLDERLARCLTDLQQAKHGGDESEVARLLKRKAEIKRRRRELSPDDRHAVDRVIASIGDINSM